ncbi:MAG: preQ(1) synthase [Acidiferrobacterales bacterium]
MPTNPSKTLETFENPHPQRDYIIAIEIPEFTCLCPRTGQPDFATLYLQYVPDQKCVELKSLKLYIWSYRDEGAFHEAVTNTILNDLVAATKPRYMRLRAKFRVRGGIYTTVIAEHRKPGWVPPPPPPDYLPRWPQSSVTSGSQEQEQAATPQATRQTTATGVAVHSQSVDEPHLLAADDVEHIELDALSAPQTEAQAVSRLAQKPSGTTERSAPVYIGLDLGTTACRAVAIDKNREIIAQAQTLIPAPLRNNEQVTQDPTQWWKAVNASIRQLLAKIDRTRVRALAVNGTSGTLMLCDEQGHPVAPALMYNDSRALDQADAIGQLAGRDCGAQGATSSLAKLLWLQSKNMDRKARYALHQADWIVGRLAGSWGHSDYNNCLKLGFDVQSLQWPQWFAQLKVNEGLLPIVHAPGEELGPLSSKTAASFGLPPDTRVVAGTTDGVAAFLSAGTTALGQGVTSLGATLVIKLLSDTPIFSPEHGVYSHRLGRRWLAGGASNSGGHALLQYFDTAQMIEMTPQLNPENFTGLNYYPLPEIGERFPTNDPKMPPKLEPLPPDTATFFQAMLEGIARIEAEGYQVLAQLGAPALTEVRTTGGGSRNRAWERIRERMLGVETKRARHGVTAYGTALVAAGIIDKTFVQQPRTGTSG